MLKKLTEEQQTSILENAIAEFGDKGLERTAVSAIAEKSGVSVGVIYKYYKDKEDLFRACLDRSVAMLRKVIDKSVSDSDSLKDQMASLIHACRIFSEKHPSYIKMYHAITIRPDSDNAAEYAAEIESVPADVYSRLFSKAKTQGEIRSEVDPRALAFFFDNLLMMMHFSYGCDYYRERMKIYAGLQTRGEPDGELLEREMAAFLCDAFGFRET